MYEVQLNFVCLYCTTVVSSIRVYVFGVYIFMYVGLLFLAFNL
jgi:hypothetical protein